MSRILALFEGAGWEKSTKAVTLSGPQLRRQRVYDRVQQALRERHALPYQAVTDDELDAEFAKLKPRGNTTRAISRLWI